MCLDLRALVLCLSFSFIFQTNITTEEPINKGDKIVMEDLMSNVEVRANDNFVKEEKKVVEPKQPSVEEIVRSKYSDDEINLLALLTMAEAEGECEEGKRLVIDTVLNRVDSDDFEKSIHDVIYQKNQFTSVWNGRMKKVSVNDEVIHLVIEELNSRTNYDVIFFTAGHYGKYGKPMFKVENHYFSSK